MTREPQWLREMVEEEILGLFSEKRDDIAGTISKLLERIPYDEQLENTLIDALQAALDLGNDDTQGAVWIALLLGEAAVLRSLPTLIQALSTDEDEELQKAAGIAIVKCGERGIDALIEGLEEEDTSPVFIKAAYEMLACVGYLQDEGIRRKVMDFLTDTIDTEVFRPEVATLTEGLAHAAAWLGHVEILPKLKEIHRQHFLGKNFLIADFIDMLDENTTGVPVIGELIPGEEEYAWAFEYQSDSFRPQGPEKPGVIAMVEGAEEAGRKIENEADTPKATSQEDLDTFYRGLGRRSGNGNGKSED